MNCLDAIEKNKKALLSGKSLEKVLNEGKEFESMPDGLAKCLSDDTAGRYRNWTFTVYLDSAPDDWFDALVALHVPAIISPYHCDDVDLNGEHKKAHFHVMLMFEGKQSLKEVRKLASYCGAANDLVFKVNSMRGMARYFCHLDNPEKAQYSPDDVTQLAGANYKAIIELACDHLEMIRMMMDFITINQIISFSFFSRYCSEYQPDWFSVLATRSTIYISQYIKAYTWELSSYNLESKQKMIEELEEKTGNKAIYNVGIDVKPSAMAEESAEFDTDGSSLLVGDYVDGQ